MLMIQTAFAVLVVFVLVLSGELLWRHKKVHPEYTRKFVHISVGTFVAFWPLFLTPLQIALLSLAFVAVVGVSYVFGIFKAIHSVQRPTWGEVFFALSVGVLAYVANNGWIYTAALLHMGLADGLAAVVGTKFGKSTQYTVLGHRKSAAGTLSFIAVSAIICAGFFAVTLHAFSWWIIPMILGAAALENLAIQGLDNVAVPLFVALWLNMLR